MDEILVLRVQHNSEYESAVNYEIRVCLNETENASCPHNLSTDDPFLEETINDLNCNQVIMFELFGFLQI